MAVGLAPNNFTFVVWAGLWHTKLTLPHRDLFVQQILPDLLLRDLNKTVKGLLSCKGLSKSSMNFVADSPANCSS